MKDEDHFDIAEAFTRREIQGNCMDASRLLAECGIFEYPDSSGMTLDDSFNALFEARELNHKYCKSYRAPAEKMGNWRRGSNYKNRRFL